MEFNINHNFYCGTSRGFLASTTWKPEDSNTPKPHYNTENKGDEITSFQFGRSNNEIVIGSVKGNIRLYDLISQSYSSEELINTKAQSEIIGSGFLEDNIVFGQKNGIVTVWNPATSNIDDFTVPVGKDADLRRLVKNEYRNNLFAVAGHKYEYALWDLEQKKLAFAAKSLPADQLYQLPQTTFANDICMLSFGGGHVGAIVTADGATMIYDDRAQRRPVFVLKKESKGGAQTSFTCVIPAKGFDYLLTTGTTRGAVHLLDIRAKNGYTGAITGYNGAVTSLAPMSVGADSAIASTCLDGNLRVHCVTTKKLLYKMYMKVPLKGVLTQTIVLKIPDLEQVDKNTENVDFDNIFATMETIDDEHENDNNHASNFNPVMVENENLPMKKTVKAGKEKSTKQLILEDEVEIKPFHIKPTELQRLWKEDVATLITDDPFKREMEFLLNKKIKLEDEDEVEEQVNLDNNKSTMKKMKSNDIYVTSESLNIPEINYEKSAIKRSKSLRRNTILKRIPKSERVLRNKDSRNVGKKHRNTKSMKIQSDVV